MACLQRGRASPIPSARSSVDGEKIGVQSSQGERVSKQTNPQAEAMFAPSSKMRRDAVVRPELGTISTSHPNAMTVNTHLISKALKTLAITSDRLVFLCLLISHSFTPSSIPSHISQCLLLQKGSCAEKSQGFDVRALSSNPHLELSIIMPVIQLSHAEVGSLAKGHLATQ